MSEEPFDHRGSDATEETRKHLDSIARLLHRAARTVWVLADEDGPSSPLHSLGLGIHLAHGLALQLLPPDDVTQPDDGLPPATATLETSAF